jgi:hypothetical protein
MLDFVKVSIDCETGICHELDRLMDWNRLKLKFGALLTALLLVAGGQALSEPPGPRQGPGDFREGYEHADYETQSLSLESRRGAETDLLAVLKPPPLGLPPVPMPADNPVTVEKVRLGRKLFFDRRLSANNTISCAMCHVAEQGFAQNELRNPVGIEGKSVRRNAPSVYNVAYVSLLFHDGREMRMKWPTSRSDLLSSVFAALLITTLCLKKHLDADRTLRPSGWLSPATSACWFPVTHASIGGICCPTWIRVVSE